MSVFVLCFGPVRETSIDTAFCGNVHNFIENTTFGRLHCIYYAITALLL